MKLEEKWEAARNEFAGKIRTFAYGSYQQLPGYSREDLEQELYIVLWECVLHYNPNKGAKFNTYFQTSARNRIITLIRHFSARRRKAELTSLDEESVSYAIQELLSEVSAEKIALDRWEIEFYVKEYGESVLDGKKARKVRRVA